MFRFSGKDGVRVNGRVIKDKSADGKYEWDFDISPLDGLPLNNNNNFRSMAFSNNERRDVSWKGDYFAVEGFGTIMMRHSISNDKAMPCIPCRRVDFNKIYSHPDYLTYASYIREL